MFILVLSLGCSDDNVKLPEEDFVAIELQEIINNKIGDDKLKGVSVSIRVGTSER
jgi:hypothetical protein